MDEPRNDWERRYRESVEASERRAEAARARQPRGVRAVEQFGFIARTWWVLTLVFVVAGIGLRGLGVEIPSAVGTTLFLACVIGFYVQMRRETRRRKGA